MQLLNNCWGSPNLGKSSCVRHESYCSWEPWMGFKEENASNMKQDQHVNTVWLHVWIDGMNHDNSIMWSWPMTATPSSKFLFGMNQLSIHIIQFTIIYFFVSNKMLFFNMFHHWPSFTQIYPRLEKNCLGKRILFRISSGPWQQLFPTSPNGVMNAGFTAKT